MIKLLFIDGLVFLEVSWSIDCYDASCLGSSSTLHQPHSWQFVHLHSLVFSFRWLYVYPIIFILFSFLIVRLFLLFSDLQLILLLNFLKFCSGHHLSFPLLPFHFESFKFYFFSSYLHPSSWLRFFPSDLSAFCSLTHLQDNL